MNNEAAQQFTISKCIAALRTLQGFDPAEKPKAFVVFKTVENREIFLGSVEDNDGSALAWLRIEMAMLPSGKLSSIEDIWLFPFIFEKRKVALPGSNYFTIFYQYIVMQIVQVYQQDKLLLLLHRD